MKKLFLQMFLFLCLFGVIAEVYATENNPTKFQQYVQDYPQDTYNPFAVAPVHSYMPVMNYFNMGEHYYDYGYYAPYSAHDAYYMYEQYNYVQRHNASLDKHTYVDPNNYSLDSQKGKTYVDLRNNR